ncbi:hypothetical protein OIU84_006985 [Salix udensis]|uniref:NAD-dependent epimerase/dehydratase domain-containing protein n=1 Tax=Salix udensis TaxID=889485 RepID=A0AAD6JZL1_9ROSI|nr:hypothetical protein OIU84_006985 [Salix udensis]
MSEKTVCVTGAGGFLASWLVKLLLSKGYVLHGTVRDPSDEKNAHLLKLENARENLKLFKTDLLDYEGLSAAITGCAGVFHVACPIPTDPASILNPKDKLLEAAVTGTRNANEQCYLKDGLETLDSGTRSFVDVRDTAKALLLIYEKDEAEGRYICSSHDITTQDLVEKLKAMYPHCNYPKSFAGGMPSMDMNSERLQTLGWKYRSLEESLVDAVKNYEERGDLAVVSFSAVVLARRSLASSQVRPLTPHSSLDPLANIDGTTMTFFSSTREQAGSINFFLWKLSRGLKHSSQHEHDGFAGVLAPHWTQTLATGLHTTQLPIANHQSRVRRKRNGPGVPIEAQPCFLQEMDSFRPPIAVIIYHDHSIL